MNRCERPNTPPTWTDTRAEWAVRHINCRCLGRRAGEHDEGLVRQNRFGYATKETHRTILYHRPLKRVAPNLPLFPDGVAAAVDAIAQDRTHAGGYLARKALGLLALVAPEGREDLADRFAGLRPDLPAIAAAVEEAMSGGEIRATIRRADGERRRVARAAARSIHRKRVATISNSALVARALVYGGPAATLVVVTSRDDEGWSLIADLRAAGVEVEAVGPEQLQADLAIVGCEAVFADGTFVARRGTKALVERLPTLVLVDRWKRINSMPPPAWASPDRYEMVRGDHVRAPA